MHHLVIIAENYKIGNRLCPHTKWNLWFAKRIWHRKKLNWKLGRSKELLLPITPSTSLAPVHDLHVSIVPIRLLLRIRAEQSHRLELWGPNRVFGLGSQEALLVGDAQPFLQANKVPVSLQIFVVLVQEMQITWGSCIQRWAMHSSILRRSWICIIFTINWLLSKQSKLYLDSEQALDEVDCFRADFFPWLLRKLKIV